MATETMSSPPATATQQKLSRYRSVRRAQEQQAQHSQQQSAPPVPAVPAEHPAVPPMPAVPEMPTTNDAAISRSKSRYHRRPTVSHATTPSAPPSRSNTMQAHQAPPSAQLPPSAHRNRAVSSPQHSAHAANSGQHRPRTAKQQVSPPQSNGTRNQSIRNEDAARDARELLNRERERQRQMKEKYEAEARALKAAKQAEIDRLEQQQQKEVEAARAKALADLEAADTLRKKEEELKAEKERRKRLQKAEEQKMREQREEEVRKAKQEERERKARLEEKARRAPVSPPVSPPKHEGGLGMFKRRKDDGLTYEPPAKTSSPPRLSLSLGDREEETIRPGGGGAVLGIDAPNSAVNAGDRRVTVVCNKKRIQLPVNPTTSPLDLIKTAATILTDPIDVRTAVICEVFSKVSITRPLRNYEHVWDVLNSWDYDSQNDLTIIDSDVDGINQDDLLSYKVSESRPEGMSCFIQYSSRPGKWTKKYITLRPDGQLVMAKNEKAKEKDHENICTLTDYDIYSVTQQKLDRVKPPKKICYAVKSMQKSNIFADESQYVHFFCTNDRGTATTFYRALQGWRSWYLKHQKGEGLKKKTTTSRKVSNADAGPVASSHNRGESVGSHYQLGAFTPLIDLDSFTKKLDSIEVHKPGEFPDDKPLGRFDTKVMHARNKSVRQKQPPPAAFSRTLLGGEGTSQSLGRSSSVRKSIDQQDDTFATGGLLGRTYTQRQVAMQTRDQTQSGPFTEGPSLLNSNASRMNQAATNESGLKRSTSVSSNHHRRTSSDLRRTASKRTPGMPAPLVDLTPAYKPPPQFANKGKGFNPGSAAGPLVECATSPEEAIQVPSSTDWRAGRPGTSRAAHGTYGTSGSERTRSLKGRGEPLAAYTQNNHTGAPEDDTNAFTGGGLLAKTGYAQGPSTGGRGVMDGSKAKGPMIGLMDNNQFANGSLLSALPNMNGPIIDRSGK